MGNGLTLADVRVDVDCALMGETKFSFFTIDVGVVVVVVVDLPFIGIGCWRTFWLCSFICKGEIKLRMS